MPRTENKIETKALWRGKEVSYKFTPRQQTLFNYLQSQLGRPCEIKTLCEVLDISLANLRVTKMQVAEVIKDHFAIVSKWGKSYALVEKI